MSGADGGVVFPDGKLLPVGPVEGNHPVGTLNIKACGLVIHHGSEDLGRTGCSQGVPVSVEDKDGGFVEV